MNSSGDLMYRKATVMNNTVLCTWNLLRGENLSVLSLSHKHTHIHPQNNCELINILTSLNVVIISQCTHIPKCQVVYLQCIEFLFVKSAPIKLKKNSQKKKYIELEFKRYKKHRASIVLSLHHHGCLPATDVWSNRALSSRDVHPSLSARFFTGAWSCSASLEPFQELGSYI